MERLQKFSVLLVFVLVVSTGFQCRNSNATVKEHSIELDGKTYPYNPDEVEQQLDHRIDYFIKIYGSKARLEEISGKTVGQIKEENWDGIIRQMIIDKYHIQFVEKQ